VILNCDFEELAALTAAIGRALEDGRRGHPVAAPPVAVSDLQELLARLVGDISVDSLAEQARLRRTVAFLADELRLRMDSTILGQHPAAEDAVLAYFDYARVLSVLLRLDRLGHEMAALVEVLTGQDPSTESAQQYSFGDD
jgi:hypothetical protein